MQLCKAAGLWGLKHEAGCQGDVTEQVPSVSLWCRAGSPSVGLPLETNSNCGVFMHTLCSRFNPHGPGAIHTAGCKAILTGWDLISAQQPSMHQSPAVG